MSSCPPGGSECNTGGGAADPTAEVVASKGSPAVPEIGNGYLYRGDTRSHEVIFKEGFKSKGKSTDLELHVFDNNTPPSDFISTSSSFDVAADFGTIYRTKKGQVYTLRLLSGRDVNRELGRKVPFPAEKEIAIPGRVIAEDILGVTPLNADGSYVGFSVPNPKWR